MPKKIIKPKDTAIFCAKLADEKIASDILMLDISGYETPPADVFLICTSDSSNQSIAILDNIMRNAKSAGISKPRVEGDETSDWILIDFFDVVVHIMNKESREFYKIEQLWNEAVFYKFNSETGKFRKDSSYTKKQLPTN